MPIPGKGHEDIGDKQQKDGAHVGEGLEAV